MKQLVVLVGCAVLLTGLAGCRSAGKEVKVTTAEDNRFPQFLVGTWRAENEKWELTFSSDGSILTIRHPFVTVPISLAEGGAYEEGREGAYSVYVMGPCTARYQPDESELKVKITIDYFQVVLPVGTAEGKMVEYLTGPVSEDRTTWTAEWVNYVELVGQEKPDLDSIPRETVIFTKVQAQ